MEATSEREFYATPGPTSDLSRHAAVVPSITDPDGAGAVARNCVLHIAALDRLGLDLPDERRADVDTRSAARIVDRVLELSSGPLKQPREPADRMIGNCYHVALLTCALLRAAGVPARTRVGFSAHLEPDLYTDHWICEVLDGGRWRRFDPDAGKPVGHPHVDDFLTGGEAWLACRAGASDSQLFGIDDDRGWRFMRGNVVRDLGALCKVELLPWDMWGLMLMPRDERPVEFIDEIARLASPDTDWHDRLARFADEPRVNPSGAVTVFEKGQRQDIPLPATW